MRVIRSLTKAELVVARLKLSPAQKNVLVLQARREGYRRLQHTKLERRYRSGDRMPGLTTWEALRTKGLLNQTHKLTRAGRGAVDTLIEVMMEDAVDER